MWRLLRLLYEALEQHSPALLGGKQHAGNPTTAEVGTNLKEPVAHRPTGGHANRPAKFDRPDIVANSLAVFYSQAPQPIADGLRSGRRLVNAAGSLFTLPCVPKMVQEGKTRSPQAIRIPAWRELTN